MIQLPRFLITSPTLMEWYALLQTQKAYLTDTTEQAEFTLKATQEDVYSQFQENQNTWKKNAKYTVDKKKARNQDYRIMHETLRSRGVTLRDSYRKVGKVKDGKVIYFYPPNKPHAKLLNDGGTVANPKQSKRQIQSEQKSLDFLDAEFLRRINS